MRHIAALDGLRGLLACWVLVGHTLWACGYDGMAGGGGATLYWLLVHPQLAVQVFIILSGFVITLSLLERPLPWAAFMLRRVLRLYPAYLVVLLIVVALAGTFEQTWHHLPFAGLRERLDVDFIDRWTADPWPDLALHLAMLHGVIETPASYAILIQTWSLSVEWQFYLLAPALCAALAGRSAGLAIGLGIAVTIAATRLVPGSLLAVNAGFFWIGILSCLVWRNPALRAAASRLGTGMLLALAALIVLLTHFSQTPLVLWLIVFGGVLAASPLIRPLQFAPVQFLGRISYSFYLCHLFALLAALRLATPFAATLGKPAFAITVLALAFAMTLPMSVLLYRCVERPGMLLARRLDRDRIDAMAATAGTLRAR